MTNADLKSRKHRILEVIILSYAETGSPVGSEFLLEKHPFGVSSATIRNVMAELEEEGLVTHPHTSAGRIPTDRGYRYYVDLLMQRGRPAPQEEEAIRSVAELKGEDPMLILGEAVRVLSDLTQEAGIALVPQIGHGSFRHLQLIPLDLREVVGVLISSEGLVRHARLELEEDLEQEELERLAAFLNAELAGMSLLQAHAHLMKSFKSVRREAAELHQRLSELSALEALFQEQASVILEGTSWIFEAQEFKDIERTRRLMRGLENKEDLAQILMRDLAAEEVKLHIGSENRGTSLTDCTIAGAPYRLRGGVMGTIGVVGPTRMNYPRVTAMVGRMAQAISRAFQEGR